MSSATGPLLHDEAQNPINPKALNEFHRKITSARALIGYLWAMKKFNLWLAEKITSGVATMWCAYLFAAIALISLPKAIKTGDTVVIISWIAQTFLQLVLLSIIMVGQKVQSAKLEQTINETHGASLAEFELAKEARGIANSELAELHQLSKDMHRLMREVEAKLGK